MKYLRKNQGFTLVELLIVIAILGAMSTVILVVVNPLEQFSRTRDAGRQQTVSQLGRDMFIRQTTAGNTFPPLVANWQTNILKASGIISSFVSVPQVGISQCGSTSPPPNSEGNICYSTSLATGGPDAIIWTLAESKVDRDIAQCGQNQATVIAWIASQEKTGITCFSSAAAVPTPDPSNNTYDNIILYSAASPNTVIPTPTPTSPPASTPTPTPTLPPASTPTPTTPPAPALPHVIGNHLVDAINNPLVLHGTQIPSAFNSGTWNNGATITQLLNPSTFSAISSWHMNVIRIPVAAYRYQLTNYMTLLDQVVQQANQAGLYVVLANFEDNRAGMGTVGGGLLDSTGLAFWQFIAQHYSANPMVMYDLINEPQNASWSDWLNGNPAGVVGMQQAVNAIRTAGGKQIVVAESIDTGTTYFNGFTSFISDPNIVYSMHTYFKTNTLRTTSGWDNAFGNLSATYPMYIGEWAFLPNANYPSFCANLDETSGAQLVNNFLTYLKQHNINWSAWAFNQYHLITDITAYVPTTLTGFNQNLTCCGAGPSAACNFGMGTILNQYTTANY